MSTQNIKIQNPSIRVLFVLGYIILITLFDSYSYGIIYQQKIQKENYSNSFWSWIFTESGRESSDEHISVPRYRIIQKTFEIIGALIIFYYCGSWCFLGILISHYLLTYDLLFYLALNQTYLFHEFQYSYAPYWLQQWYQAGYFVLKPFNPMKFYILGISGILISVGFCFVEIKTSKSP